MNIIERLRYYGEIIPSSEEMMREASDEIEQLLTDWAKELGISDSTLHARIKKWGINKALSR